MLEVASLLGEGFIVDLYGHNSMPIDAYHAVIHFGVNTDGLELFKSIKNTNIPLILWPNLWWPENPDKGLVDTIRFFFESADYLIFKSNSEQNNNLQYYDFKKQNILKINAGVHPSFLDATENEIDTFKRLYGLTDFILWVGVIQRQKNQLEAIKALKDFEMPLVFLGNGVDSDYFNECRTHAADKDIFIPQLSHNSTMLRAAFAASTLYLEIPSEPAGLSALEAGCLGKNIVLNAGNWTAEQFQQHVGIVHNPFNHDEILQVVKNRLGNSFNNEIMAVDVKMKHLLPHSLKPLLNLLRSF